MITQIFKRNIKLYPLISSYTHRQPSLLSKFIPKYLSSTNTGEDLQSILLRSIEKRENAHTEASRRSKFIEKMYKAYRTSKKWEKTLETNYYDNIKCSITSSTPRKDILRRYMVIGNKRGGFSPDLISQTLSQLSKCMKCGDMFIYNDLTHRELRKEWRMEELVGDLIHGCRSDVYFSPTHLSQCTWGMKELGYKNIALQKHLFRKLYMLMGVDVHSDLIGVEDGRGKEGREGYMGYTGDIGDIGDIGDMGNSDHNPLLNDELTLFLNTLMEYQGKSTHIPNTHNIPDTSTAEIEELKNEINGVILAAEENIYSQKEMTTAINNIRSQYEKLYWAIEEKEFLQSNKYIYYGLLEIEELLVESGLLEPKDIHFDRSLPQVEGGLEGRMERAKAIFNFLSFSFYPQTSHVQGSQILQYIAQHKLNDGKEGEFKYKIDDSHNKMTIEELSSILGNLGDISKCSAREASQNESDYPHPYLEQASDPHPELTAMENSTTKIPSIGHDYMRIRHEYTPIYAVTVNCMEHIYENYIRDRLKKGGEGVGAYLNCIYAYSKIGLMLNTEIDQYLDIVDRDRGEGMNQLSLTHLINGLLGLSVNPYRSQKHTQVFNLVLSTLNNKLLKHKMISDGIIDLEGKINILWAMANMSKFEDPLFYELIKSLGVSTMDDILLGHLPLTQAKYLRDIHYSLLYELHEQSPLRTFLTQNAFLNNSVFNDRNIIHNNPELTEPKYDPFSKLLIKGLRTIFALGDPDPEEGNRRYKESKEEKLQGGSGENIYNADIIIPHKMKKLLIFLMNRTDFAVDGCVPMGDWGFRFRILKAMHPYLRGIGIPVHQILDYDLTKLKVNVNQKLNFHLLIENQYDPFHINFPEIIKFSKVLLKEMDNSNIKNDSYFGSHSINEVYSKLAELISTIIKLSTQIEHAYEINQQEQLLNHIKITFAKLELLFDALPPEIQDQINKLSKEGSNCSWTEILDYSQNIITKIEDFIKSDGGKKDTGGKTSNVSNEYNVSNQSNESNVSNEYNASNISKSWIGCRLTLEVPGENNINSPHNNKKLSPEILNRELMWNSNYFKYKRWEDHLRAAYDQLNLLILPDPHPQSFYFSTGRKVPHGIFPDPNHFRGITKNQQFRMQNAKYTSDQEDVKFLRSPMENMLNNELNKNKRAGIIGTEVKLMVNLLNLQNGMKLNYSDEEIIDTILNLPVLEQLIKEHNMKIKGHRESITPNALYLDRGDYKGFLLDTQSSRKSYDPFTHFWLEEAYKKEVPKKEMKEIRDKYAGDEIKRTQMERKIEDILIAQDEEDHDYQEIGSYIKKRIHLKYDLKSLLEDINPINYNPELQDLDLNEEEFLNKSRLIAETKLIKYRIIYKLHCSPNIEISPAEEEYLNLWVEDIKHRNLLNIGENMGVVTPTQLKFLDLSVTDINTLNSIPLVGINSEYDSYSLSELLLELSHFFCSSVIAHIDSQLLNHKLSHKWRILSTQLYSTYENKEIGFISHKLEEIIWRLSGKFSEEDIGLIKEFLMIKRGKGAFDREFVEMDMKSLQEWITDIDPYDDRMQLLMTWIARKEAEINARKHLPFSEEDLKTDAELNKLWSESQDKGKDELLLRSTGKSADSLSRSDLHGLTNELCDSLPLFNYQYPIFITRLIESLMQHPNISSEDKQVIEQYTKFYELNWKHLDKEYLAFHPIYKDGLHIKEYYAKDIESTVREEQQNAAIPFMPQLISKILHSTTSFN